MSPWHASAHGIDPTFPQPLQLVDLTFLSAPLPPDVHADLENCLRATLQGIENTLRPGEGANMLCPSGATMDSTGTMSLVADHQVDYAYDDDAVITALNNMLKEIRGQAAQLRCSALGYYVRMRVPTPGSRPQGVTPRKSTEWQSQDATPPPGTLEAVVVDLEHRAGVAFSVFMPYTWQQASLFVGDLLATSSRRQVWS